MSEGALATAKSLLESIRATERGTMRRMIGAAFGLGREHWTVVLFAALTVGLSAALVPGLRGLLGALFGVVVAWIASVDARQQLIPNAANAAGFALGLAYAAVGFPELTYLAVAEVVLRAGVIALLFLLLRLGYFRWRGREGIGLGDVKLAGVAGIWLDWTVLPICIEIAALGALAGYGARQFLTGQELQLSGRIPFGCFFAPAIWLCWLGQEVLLPLR